MKFDITNEALRLIQRECDEIHIKNRKISVVKRMMYCKFCAFQANDDFEQHKHFEETGHRTFLPLRFIHERVGKARLLRPWDNNDANVGEGVA